MHRQTNCFTSLKGAVLATVTVLETYPNGSLSHGVMLLPTSLQNNVLDAASKNVRFIEKCLFTLLPSIPFLLYVIKHTYFSYPKNQQDRSSGFKTIRYMVTFKRFGNALQGGLIHQQPEQKTNWNNQPISDNKLRNNFTRKS